MKHAAAFATVVFTGLILVAAAFAADAPPEDQTRDPLIVTAQKVEEDAMKIPVSISVFTDTLLEDANIDNVLEMTRFTPNVYMKKSTSENMISIRGLTPFDASVYSPTAFYVDDVQLPLHYMHNIDFFDLERVEVLKGPQGTLYGGNSESGVINVITRRPSDVFSSRLALDAGAYPSIDGDPLLAKAGVSLSGPVQPGRLYFGAAAIVEHGQGVMTNLENGDDNAGDMERYNGRFSIRYTPSDPLELSLIADAMKNRDHIAVYRFETGPDTTAPYTVRHEETDWSHEDGNGQAFRVRYKAGGFDLLSVTGRRDYVNTNQQDYDNTADPMNNWGEVISDYDDNILTQELRISSDSIPDFKWLGGLYAFKEETRITQTNDVAVTDTFTGIDNKGYAFYGNATYTVFDRLHLSAGLRYDAQFQEGRNNQSFYNAGIGAMDSRSLSVDQDFKEILPRFSVGYDVTPGIYTYALMSKGFLAGGYNYAMAVDDFTFVYGPEYVWNHEVGIKASWLNDRLVTRLSLFYLEIEDKQVFEQVTGSNPGTKIDNAAEAHTRGLELEVTARPWRGLDLFTGFGLIRGEYDEWIATEWNSTYTGYVTTDYSGKKLPNVPEYSLSLGAQYRFENGFFIRGDVNGVGSFYGDHVNTVEEEAYALVNLKLGYETETFDVYLWGKNVFDKQYHTIKYEWDGNELVQDGEPLSLGFSVAWRF